jgi:uncharacterized protein (DUF58 family)
MRLAAGLLYVLVGQGDRGGLATFGEQVISRHAPAGSAAGLKPLLIALEQTTAAGKGDIAAALHQACQFLPRRSLAIVISDFLQAPATVLAGIRHLHHDGHDVRALHVVDRAELALTETGLVEAIDAETGERIEVDLDEVAGDYRRAVTEHLDEIRRGCLGSGADYRLISTDTPISEALRGM